MPTAEIKVDKSTTTKSFANLSIISWNVCEARASEAAPDLDQRTQVASKLIREEVLCPRLAAHSPNSSFEQKLPDVVALQECPTGTWGQEEFGPYGYVSMGTQLSHCGWVDLLILRELADNARPIPLKINSADNLPSVACVLVLPNKTEVAFSSSHLSPFKDGAADRAQEYRKLTEIVTKECSNCVMMGDYNMRQSEDSVFENMSGGGWIDAWKGCGANPSLKFTWDTFTK